MDRAQRLAALAIIATQALIRPGVVAAQGAEWQFTSQSARPVAIPEWLRGDSLRVALGYDSGEAVDGFRADLNRDGTPDYVFRFSTTLCGGNCEYLFVDGRTHRVLGRLGGSVVVVRPPTINGYPVIHAYGRSSADAGYWSTAVFDGRRYTTIGVIFLQGPSQEELFRTLRAVPFWPPPAAQR